MSPLDTALPDTARPAAAMPGTRRRAAPRRMLPRVATGVVVGVAAVLVAASAASAHVRVDGLDTSQGGYGVLTFRVPTESATASTTELTVTFPADTPIVSVSTQPKAGWTATITTARLKTPVTTDDGTVDTYVSTVDWKADSAETAIKPGEFDTFSVSAGPLPDAASVSFPALQRYSDGTTVNWNERSSNGTEPAHPAPTLQLTPAASPSGSASPGPSVTAEAAGTSPASGGAAWTGVAGLIAGVLGLIAGVVALVRTGRKQTPAP